MRVLIIGNSGSGKSTLAAHLARSHGLAVFDLDTVAWLPVTPPQRRPLAEAVEALEAFMDAHEAWVIEGCYADLLEAVSHRATALRFLNPGVAACVAHCEARPWEPHKYPSKEAQDANLAFLLDWVRGYDDREGPLGLAAHRALFEGFGGDKAELRDLAEALRGG